MNIIRSHPPAMARTQTGLQTQSNNIMKASENFFNRKKQSQLNHADPAAVQNFRAVALRKAGYAFDHTIGHLTFGE